MKCMVCENNSDGFTLCNNCVTDIYLEMGNTDAKAIMEYLKTHDTKKFNDLITNHSLMGN